MTPAIIFDVKFRCKNYATLSDAGARRRKWRFAGKILRTPTGDEPARWSHVLTKWTPPTKRKFGDGRPRTRWEDDIRKHCGHRLITDPARWMPTADDAREWKRLGRTFDRPQPPRQRRRP
ncbi:Reverse transcriptase domain-containing protein [Aphelenchoides fujianensis]|nr:Reverse transcriptase domain-containing protein [Aphelenchoides fujianensis]